MPEDAARYPADLMLPTTEWTVERTRTAKYALAGTVEPVKAEFDAPKRIGGAGELGWFAWFFDQGAMPGGAEMRQIELFAERIIPAFRRRARHTRVKIEAHRTRQDEGVRVSPGASGVSPANSLPASQAIP